MVWYLGMFTCVFTYTQDFISQNVSLLKEYPKRNSLDCKGMFFGSSAPTIGGVLMKKVSKGSFTRFFQIEMAPRGGGGGGVLPDPTRRGTDYLHTTLLEKYLKFILLDSEIMALLLLSTFLRTPECVMGRAKRLEQFVFAWYYGFSCAYLLLQ